MLLRICLVIAILAGLLHEPLPLSPPIQHHTSTLLNENNADKKTSLSPKAKSKLGTLAVAADKTVAEVIRSRGGGAAVVGKAGHWAGKTLAETAEAAVAGDKSAETAVKVAKQAGRLGQKH